MNIQQGLTPVQHCSIVTEVNRVSETSEEPHFVSTFLGRKKIYISDPKRARKYRRGVSARLSRLSREYLISGFNFGEIGIFVDVGANSGEFGLICARNRVRYLGLEPDPAAFQALDKNVGCENSLRVAVGATCGLQRFVIKTESADSSFATDDQTENTVQVETHSLDCIFLSPELSELKNLFIKIDTEGYEVEALKGAPRTLGKTAWISVDAGPERNGRSTYPEVLRILLDSGFEIARAIAPRSHHRPRETFLMYNSNLVQVKWPGASGNSPQNIGKSWILTGGHA